jgi:hypothetical protein
VLPIGPAVLLHEIPLTPDIDQEPVPVGVAPVDGPETVAVKVNVEPRATLALLVVTTTPGTNFVMVRLKVLLGPTAM